MTTEHWKKYPRVTEILGVISKGKGFEYWLKTQGMKADAITREACDIGSEIHQFIDLYHTEGFCAVVEDDTENNRIIRRSVANYMDWFTKSKAVCIESELRVWSDKYKFRGTLDRVVKIDGKFILDDLKNSSRIYKNYVLQVEMYRIAYEEMTGLKIDGLRIIRIDKGTGEIEIKKYKPQKSNEKLIKQIVALYNWNKSNKDTSIDTEIIR